MHDGMLVSNIYKQAVRMRAVCVFAPIFLLGIHMIRCALSPSNLSFCYKQSSICTAGGRWGRGGDEGAHGRPYQGLLLH